MSYNPTDPSRVPEVQSFELAKGRLQAFKDANPKFFEVLEGLVHEYNISREAADKAVRAQCISCGDFDFYQKQTKIDGKALHDALGRGAFIKAGGTIKMEAKYAVDKKKLELAVAQGLVSAELAAEVTKEEARYHTPEAVSLP